MEMTMIKVNKTGKIGFYVRAFRTKLENYKEIPYYNASYVHLFLGAHHRHGFNALYYPRCKKN